MGDEYEPEAEQRRSSPLDQGSEAESAPTQAPAPQTAGPKAGAIGNSAVQDAISGNGLGAFSSVVAAEMMMANAGLDPGLMGSDSNSSMQRAMMLGGGAVQPGLEQVMASMMGGGALPEGAMNRVQTGTGGTMGPVSGIPGTLPGIPRHQVDTSNAGVSTAKQRSTDARAHEERDPGNVEHVFGAMANLTENELDGALSKAGQQLLSGVGQQGMAEIAQNLGGDPTASQQGPTSSAERQAAQTLGAPTAQPTFGEQLGRVNTGLKAVSATAGGLENEAARNTMKRIGDTGSTLVNVARLPEQLDQLRNGQLDGEDVKAATGLVKTGVDAARLVTNAPDASNLGRSASVVAAVAGIAAAPTHLSTLTDGNWEKKDGDAVWQLTRTAVDTADAAGKVSDYVTTKNAATAAFQEAAPGASKSMMNAASAAAANSAIGDASRPASKQAMAAAMEKIQANSTLAEEMGTSGRAAARSSQNAASKAATVAAEGAKGTSALAKAGKLGARFVPGLNVATAALDTTAAYNTLNDPKASTTAKVTSVLTAAGSIAAASNIPIVSQVGAAVSVVSSLWGALWG